MDRRSFFKNVGLISGATIVAPSLLVKAFTNGETLSENQVKRLNDNGYWQAELNNNILDFYDNVTVRINDTILLSNGRKESQCLITQKIDSKKYKIAHYRQNPDLKQGRVCVFMYGKVYEK